MSDSATRNLMPLEERTESVREGKDSALAVLRCARVKTDLFSCSVDLTVSVSETTLLYGARSCLTT